MDSALKKQVQDGLATLYNRLGCNAVAREIKKGRNVTKNAEYGIRLCVHGKVGARVNPKTLKFYPQTKKGRMLEKNFITKVNLMLKSGGFRPMSSTLLSSLRKKDQAFKQQVAKRRKERR